MNEHLVYGGPINAKDVIDDIINRAYNVDGLLKSSNFDPISELNVEHPLYKAWYDLLFNLCGFPYRWCQEDPHLSICFLLEGNLFAFAKKTTLDKYKPKYDDIPTITSLEKGQVVPKNACFYRVHENIYRVSHIPIEVEKYTPKSIHYRMAAESAPEDVIDLLSNLRTFVEIRTLSSFGLSNSERDSHRFQNENTIASNSLKLDKKIDNRYFAATWEEITIAFIADDCIQVSSPSRKKKIHYAEMGFSDGRKGDQPDSRWLILLKLAQHGEISWNTDVDQSTRNKAKSAISDIRKRLKKILNIDEDPFYDYRQVKAYRPKFNLIDSRPNRDRN